MELHQTDRILPERRNHITHQSGRSPGRKKFIETSMKTVGGVTGENASSMCGTFCMGSWCDMYSDHEKNTTRNKQTLCSICSGSINSVYSFCSSLLTAIVKMINPGVGEAPGKEE